MTKGISKAAKTSSGEAPAAPAALDRLIKKWKEKHVYFKAAEVAVGIAKNAVAVAMQSAGVEIVASKHGGTIGFRHSETKSVDVHRMLKDDGLTDEAINAKIAKYTVTKQSAPYIQAPNKWSTKADSEAA